MHRSEDLIVYVQIYVHNMMSKLIWTQSRCCTKNNWSRMTLDLDQFGHCVDHRNLAVAKYENKMSISTNIKGSEMVCILLYTCMKFMSPNIFVELLTIF